YSLLVAFEPSSIRLQLILCAPRLRPLDSAAWFGLSQTCRTVPLDPLQKTRSFQTTWNHLWHSSTGRRTVVSADTFREIASNPEPQRWRALRPAEATRLG